MQKEFERKAALTATEFSALREKLCAIAEGKRFTQENHYFDTKDLALKRTSRTLRVRKIDDALTLEYKHGKTVKGDVRICQEDNRAIAAMPTELYGDAIGESPTECYTCLGVLVTERTEYEVDGATVALDESRYLGVTDYEIEVETAGDIPLPPVLLSLGIDFSKKTAGKYHRFVKKLFGIE